MQILLENITKQYKSESGISNLVLNDISLEIWKRDMIAITGKSGSGKTSLLRILGLLDPLFTGKYYFNERVIVPRKDREMSRIRNEKIGFVSQDFSLILQMNVYDNIAVPIYLAKKKFSSLKNGVLEKAYQLGIGHLLKEPVKNLSGGEQQRVAIARALIMNPDIILADEPTGALDRKTSEKIMELLMDINRSGTTIVIVTHDSEVAALCRREYHLEDGKILLGR
ncbi:ABC transporter ATP-binding protein [[Clostridium] polysaccharolyticum]|uniref:Putative ABC transport system ATP-binding protein n=1 Tax=[Clostridium] polysaccharolyticum TaxID=29364 RepID=A0A1I0AU37_9FIRM|nr:ABC transporter ATP-binding protein [[Clostridium] polysaccharolyticum]SES97259.1 putative ABC transport system ATP-binding protein [[Clostridium] polysaccharolyticum]